LGRRISKEELKNWWNGSESGGSMERGGRIKGQLCCAKEKKKRSSKVTTA
jgi:hypothetical protein